MDTLYGNRQQLMTIADQAQETLMTASATFPFDLFPDSIVVDRAKVTVHKQIFWGQTESTSIQMEDILNVEMIAGPFFASLKIFTRIPNMDPLSISYLPRQTALNLQSLIEGYLIALTKKIDCTNIPKRELVNQLMQLGREAGS